MINKKGLSDIIATVLIILLALAAVVIVWQFIRPMFTTSGETLTLQSKCMQVEVEPVSCTYTLGSASVTIKLNKGIVSQVTGIVEHADSTTAVGSSTTPPSMLSTVTFSIPVSKVPTKLKAAAVVASDKDPTQTLTCDASSTVVNCVLGS